MSLMEILDNHSCGDNDVRAKLLQGGTRQWWDIDEQKMISAVTLFLAQGCPDWGEKNGKRNHLCTFCSIPNAVIAYRQLFYDGKPVPEEDHVRMFRENLKETIKNDTHTLMLFNGGSFLSQISNPLSVQKLILNEISNTGIRRLVIESRADLITEESLKNVTDILNKAGIRLSIRIGIESQNDELRIRVLRKGHKRAHLERAVHAMKTMDVRSGGYCLLKPAPEAELKKVMGDLNADKDEINAWATQEAKATLDWVLSEEGLNMDEAYYCSTNIGDGSVLHESWKNGEFILANLWMVYDVLKHAIEKHGKRVHLLPFKEEPDLIAVPSNHKPEGIAQNLKDGVKCDHAFHQMFSLYRETMDPSVLVAPSCDCRPIGVH